MGVVYLATRGGEGGKGRKFCGHGVLSSLYHIERYTKFQRKIGIVF